jgi:hypothetical protein
MHNLNAVAVAQPNLTQRWSSYDFLVQFHNDSTRIQFEYSEQIQAGRRTIDVSFLSIDDNPDHSAHESKDSSIRSTAAPLSGANQSPEIAATP